MYKILELQCQNFSEHRYSWYKFGEDMHKCLENCHQCKILPVMVSHLFFSQAFRVFADEEVSYYEAINGDNVKQQNSKLH